MPPRLVIFDMDDVLCHYDLGRRLRALSQISGKTPRDIRAAIWDSGFEDDADSGGYPDADTYLVDFSNDSWSTEQRAVILGAAISIDFDFFENNQSRGGLLSWIPTSND